MEGTFVQAAAIKIVALSISGFPNIIMCEEINNINSEK